MTENRAAFELCFPLLPTSYDRTKHQEQSGKKDNSKAEIHQNGVLNTAGNMQVVKPMMHD